MEFSQSFSITLPSLKYGSFIADLEEIRLILTTYTLKVANWNVPKQIQFWNISSSFKILVVPKEGSEYRTLSSLLQYQRYSVKHSTLAQMLFPIALLIALLQHYTRFKITSMKKVLFLFQCIYLIWNYIQSWFRMHLIKNGIVFAN